MNVLAKFLEWAWDLGITSEFGNTRFQDWGTGMQPLRLLRLRLEKDDRLWQHDFRDFDDLEKFLISHGTSIGRELCVPAFEYEKRRNPHDYY